MTPPEPEWSKVCDIFWKAAISPDRNHVLLRTLILSHSGGFVAAFITILFLLWLKEEPIAAAMVLTLCDIFHLHSSCCFHQEQLKAKWSCQASGSAQWQEFIPLFRWRFRDLIFPELVIKLLQFIVAANLNALVLVIYLETVMCYLYLTQTFIPVSSHNSIKSINRITITATVSVVPGTQTVILAGCAKQWFRHMKMKNNTKIEWWKRECWIARYRHHTTGVTVPNIVT